MGFRQGAFARIWSVNDEGNYSTANVSVSRKNKETGKYNIEFSDGYVRLVGSAHEAAKSLGLPTREEFDPQSDKGVTIKISNCDVTNNYDTKTKKLYTNCVIFGFEIPDNNGGNSSDSAGAKSAGKGKRSAPASNKAKKPAPADDYAMLEDDDDQLPF